MALTTVKSRYFALLRPSNNHITPVLNAARPAVQLCWR
jgi:hypothetical protein